MNPWPPVTTMMPSFSKLTWIIRMYEFSKETCDTSEYYRTYLSGDWVIVHLLGGLRSMAALEAIRPLPPEMAMTSEASDSGVTHT